MIKYKTVRRKYVTKSGEIKLYTYNYRVVEGKHKKVVGYGVNNHKLLNKNGKTTKYYDKYVEAIKKNKDMDEAQKRDMLLELDVEMFSAKNKGEELTTSRFESHYLDNKIDRYIYNMGGDIDALAEDMGLRVEDLRNNDNWDWITNTFKFDGVLYTFKFDYEGGGVTWAAK